MKEDKSHSQSPNVEHMEKTEKFISERHLSLLLYFVPFRFWEYLFDNTLLKYSLVLLTGHLILNEIMLCMCNLKFKN